MHDSATAVPRRQTTRQGRAPKRDARARLCAVSGRCPPARLRLSAPIPHSFPSARLAAAASPRRSAHKLPIHPASSPKPTKTTRYAYTNHPLTREKTPRRTLRGRSIKCPESSTDGSRKSERKRKDAMRNALQKHAHRGFGTIGEREPRSERATATAGTPQRRSTDRRESNAKAVARTKGRKASPCTLSGTRSAAFAIRKTHDSGHGYGKSSPAREEKETRGAYGGERRTGAHAEEAGTRRRAQGAQAHLPEPGQITLRPQSVTRGGLCPVECVAGA